MAAIFNQWKDNIKKNAKTISAIIGDIIITIILVSLYAIQAGLSIETFFFVLIMGIKPFLIAYVNAVTKSEINSAKELAQQAENIAKEAAAKAAQETALLKQKVQHLEEKSLLVHDKKSLITELAHVREIAEYRVLVAAKDGKVPNGVIANKDWNDSNEIIETLEKG